MSISERKVRVVDNIRIENNSNFEIVLIPTKIDLEPMEDEEHGGCIYTGVKASMFSNLAETPEEMEELSEMLKYTAKAQRVFADILKKRF